MKEEERLPFEQPLCPARRCVRDGGPGLLLLLCACVGWAWVSVRPGFSMCRGGALGGTRSCLFSCAGRILFWLCGAVVLRCAVPRKAGTLGPAAGHGVAWPMEVEVGIFSLAWMGTEREGP